MGNLRRAGLIAVAEVLERVERGGRLVTTSGSSRVLSARSIAVIAALDARESIGAVYTLIASLPQVGQLTPSDTVPTGRLTSKPPC